MPEVVLLLLYSEMKIFFCAFALLASVTLSHATMSVGLWVPMFKGIDHKVGTNFPDAALATLQVVHCVRVDLTDPDVQLFTTPRASNYIADVRETLNLSVPDFLKNYGLQVASDANFYDVNTDAKEQTPFCFIFQELVQA